MLHVHSDTLHCMLLSGPIEVMISRIVSLVYGLCPGSARDLASVINLTSAFLSIPLQRSKRGTLLATPEMRTVDQLLLTYDDALPLMRIYPRSLSLLTKKQTINARAGWGGWKERGRHREEGTISIRQVKYASCFSSFREKLESQLARATVRSADRRILPPKIDVPFERRM